MSILPVAVEPAEWQLIRRILEEHVPEYDVWAFGSRARRTAKPYSDLDLAIVTPAPLGLDRLAALAEAFSESDLPYKVDLVDWSGTSAAFREIIERDKVLIHTSRAAHPNP